MKIVLVMLRNFQEYILDNIFNLKKFGNTDICIITDTQFNDKFNGLNVEIVNVDKIINDYAKISASLSKTFRNGFWELTSYRFIAIQKYMELYKVENIVHLENDILLYKKIDDNFFHTKDKILLTMDSDTRCIPGIMFIPNHNILKKCLDMFDVKKYDMFNWGDCYNKTNMVDTLPIFITNKQTKIIEKITANFNKYNCIFDAAAIGQYIGGVDPRNVKPGVNTIGFVNETCVINYSKYKIEWIKSDNKNIPYLVVDNNKIPIINLHIHCKDLKKFMN